MACFEKQALSPFPQVAGKKLSIRNVCSFQCTASAKYQKAMAAERYNVTVVMCDSILNVFLLQKNQNTLFVLYAYI